MGSEVFISYRRGDSAGYARALHGAPRERFGEQQLFMDVDTIAPSIDFVKRIREAVEQCKVLIAVIGEDWLETRNEHGQRRLDDARDYVRIEIAGALERDIPVIPVLLDKVSMPDAERLPDPLKPLSRRNAIALSHEHFQSGVERVVATLSTYVPPLALDEQDDSEGVKQRSMSKSVKAAWIGALSAIVMLLIGVAATLLRSSLNDATPASAFPEVSQQTSGAGSPAVQGVQGDVLVNISVPSSESRKKEGSQ